MNSYSLVISLFICVGELSAWTKSHGIHGRMLFSRWDLFPWEIHGNHMGIHLVLMEM